MRLCQRDAKPLAHVGKPYQGPAQGFRLAARTKPWWRPRPLPQEAVQMGQEKRSRRGLRFYA